MNRANKAKLERGKANLRWAVDMAKAEASRQTKSPPNKALQANTAGALSVRLRPRNNSQQLAGLTAKTTAV